MALTYEVKDLGYTNITLAGQTIALSNDAILAIADEIRARVQPASAAPPPDGKE